MSTTDSANVYIYDENAKNGKYDAFFIVDTNIIIAMNAMPLCDSLSLSTTPHQILSSAPTLNE